MSKKAGKKKEETVKGVLELTRSGMGYVIVEGRDTDVLIRPGELNKAMNGDTVRVRVKSPVGNKRTEGTITEVVERKQTEFIGTIEMSDHFAFFIPSSEKAMPDFYISKENLSGAGDKDHVVVKMLRWDKGEKKPEGKVLSVLEMKNPVDLAMKEIIVQNGFSIAFPPEVLVASDVLDAAITEEELKKRRDFRDVLTFTIDPADAKDFDDALSIKKLDNGDYEIGVHIADVSHFVEAGSVLDEEAYKRATSVYLPDRVVPMLPEKISNELCSLRPDEDKYCFPLFL